MTQDRKNISQVSEELGIPKDLLRMWERRYSFPTPTRDNLGDRIFSNEQVEKLSLIKKLMDLGHRPGTLMSMTSFELETELNTYIESKKTELWEELLKKIKSDHNQSLESFLNNKIEEHGIENFLSQQLVAYNEIVGFAWMLGDLSIAEEHFYSEVVENVLRQKCVASCEKKKKLNITIASLPGELHRIGMLSVNLFIKNLGYDSASLGVDIPVNDVYAYIKKYQSQVLIISLSVNYKPSIAEDYIQILLKKIKEDNLDIQIWCGGKGAEKISIPQSRSFKIISHFSELRSELEQLCP